MWKVRCNTELNFNLGSFSYPRWRNWSIKGSLVSAAYSYWGENSSLSDSAFGLMAMMGMSFNVISLPYTTFPLPFTDWKNLNLGEVENNLFLSPSQSSGQWDVARYSPFNSRARADGKDRNSLDVVGHTTLILFSFPFLYYSSLSNRV